MKFIDIIYQLTNHIRDADGMGKFSLTIEVNSTDDRDRLRRRIMREGEAMQPFSDFRYDPYACIELFGVPIDITVKACPSCGRT